MKLDPIIQIGWCKSYGDADFGVSSRVSTYSKRQMDELRLMTLSALRCADEMWFREQEKSNTQCIGTTHEPA
jgi:hypothetical protein